MYAVQFALELSRVQVNFVHKTVQGEEGVLDSDQVGDVDSRGSCHLESPRSCKITAWRYLNAKLWTCATYFLRVFPSVQTEKVVLVLQHE